MRVFFVLLGIFIAVPLWADEQTSCFCLENPNTRMIERYGCEARTIESRGIERVECQTSDFESRENVEEFADFARVLAGEGQCLPCYATPSDPVDDGIRVINQVDNSSDTPQNEASE